MRYEYTVVPAPNRGEKAKGAKTPTDRYVIAMTEELNRMAAEGWNYVRAETLPSEERSGIAGRSTVYHNMLVFRRPLAALEDTPPAATADTPQPEYPASATPPAAPVPTPPLPDAAAPKKLDEDTKPIANPVANEVSDTQPDMQADQEKRPFSNPTIEPAVPPKPRQPENKD